MSKTIWAGNVDGSYLHPLTFSATVDEGESIKPGDVVFVDRTSGKAKSVVDSTTGTGTSYTQFVVLEEGAHLGGSVNDVFVAGDRITIAFPRNGEHFYCRVTGGSDTLPLQSFHGVAGELVSSGVGLTNDKNSFLSIEPLASDYSGLSLFLKL